MRRPVFFVTNSIDDVTADPINHRKSDLKFAWFFLFVFSNQPPPSDQPAKAPLGCALSDSCLVYLPTPGPSAVPAN